MSVLLLQGDARQIPLADHSVHCVVTSPPFFAKYGCVMYTHYMTKTNCPICNKEVVRGGVRRGTYCSFDCKAEAQRQQKPVTREWLEQKYVVEGLSTYQIAKLVKRDPKRVHDWMRDLQIPLRVRAWSVEEGTQPYHGADWLRKEYVQKQRSASDIAKQFGVTDSNIFFYLERFGIPRRSMSEARAVKKWSLPGALNGMYGKRGADVPNWKGGVTPERQAFYSSLEWAAVVKAIWQRDQGTCQHCQVKYAKKHRAFHIHHIVSFAVRELRLEASNLVLLCAACHRFVHSKRNTEKLFIREVEKGGGA